MILRRVIEHVKSQNWTAVALDGSGTILAALEASGGKVLAVGEIAGIFQPGRTERNARIGKTYKVVTGSTAR